MAAADRTNDTEQLQRLVNTVRRYQNTHSQRNQLCDLTSMADNASTQCHDVVFSSDSSNFFQLLCDSEYNIDIIDITPLSEQILTTVVGFMYNSDYVINDDNVIELCELSMTWNHDSLPKICVAYMNDNLSLDNICRFYNFAADNVNLRVTQTVNKLIREHFTSLHELGHLRELSLKNFTTIIEHDKINVKNEDVIFNSAVQIIDEHSSDEDINDCLEMIRVLYVTSNLIMELLHHHPRARAIVKAGVYQMDKALASVAKPLRYWAKEIYYIGTKHRLYHYGSRSRIVAYLPDWVDDGSSVASNKEQVVIVGGCDGDTLSERALLLDIADNAEQVNLPSLPETLRYTGVALSDDGIYVVGGSNSRSVYHLSFGSDSWQVKKPLPYELCTPLVIQHQQLLYVLGGYRKNGNQSSVLQYNIEDDTWKRCSDLPIPCTSDASGVVVHDGKITVVTIDSFLMYDEETDTWTVKHYNQIGYYVNAFVRNGQIWAVVWHVGRCTLMSYDDLNNVWETDHAYPKKAINTKLFC